MTVSVEGKVLAMRGPETQPDQKKFREFLRQFRVGTDRTGFTYKYRYCDIKCVRLRPGDDSFFHNTFCTMCNITVSLCSRCTLYIYVVIISTFSIIDIHFFVDLYWS